MIRGPFSGRDVVKVMVNSGIYEWCTRMATTQSYAGSRQTTTIRMHERFRFNYMTN
jgi:hypothetical protein